MHQVLRSLHRVFLHAMCSIENKKVAELFEQTEFSEYCRQVQVCAVHRTYATLVSKICVEQSCSSITSNAMLLVPPAVVHLLSYTRCVMKASYPKGICTTNDALRGL
jgi:hypothetical protein